MRNAILAAVAVLAVFALAVGGAAAHGTDEADTSHDDEKESADAWGTWMEQQMIEHMGEERAAQMEARMPMTYEEMGRHMASHDDDSDGGTKGGNSGMGCH